MKLSKTVLSVDPWKTRAEIMPSYVYARISDIASPLGIGAICIPSRKRAVSVRENTSV